MLGAVIGDIAGSRFEWNNIKSKDFAFFNEKCSPTDDSIMTFAVARAILLSGGDMQTLGENAVRQMQAFGRRYPHAGYGTHFYGWICAADPQPYGSWGNGAAMRVSPCGFAARTLEEAEAMAKAVTEVTHSHPEGLRGAGAVAAAVYLARTGESKEAIRAYIEEHYYRIGFRLGDIRASYTFDVSCRGSVPQALEAFFEADGFEDAIRNAISIGGDSDTIAAITGGVAEAFWGIPVGLRAQALGFLGKDLLAVLRDFEEKYGAYTV